MNMERFQSWHNFAVDDLIDSLMGVAGKHASIFIDRNVYAFEVFVNNTNLTFLSFLYKISIKMSLKNKVASSGI